MTLRHQLPVRWLETRTASERAVYPELVRAAHDMILAGLGWIEPGRTTTDELRWWYERTILDAGFTTWFHPLVSIQRGDGESRGTSFAERDPDSTFRPGDLIHVDLGLVWAACTPTRQHQAYVLLPGESEAPEGLRAGYVDANRAQDLLTETFRSGAIGNEILSETRAKLEAAGIDGRIYSHPLGLHGHGAGPLIGLWDNQVSIPGRGNLEVHESTLGRSSWAYRTRSGVGRRNGRVPRRGRRVLRRNPSRIPRRPASRTDAAGSRRGLVRSGLSPR